MTTPVETMEWLDLQFRARADEDGEAHTAQDAEQVETARRAFGAALEALHELLGLYHSGKTWAPEDHPVVRAHAAIAAAEGRETLGAPTAEQKPRFVIVISEGGVTDVVSDDPAIVGMPFATIDHDTEGLGPDDEVLLIPQAEGEPREGYMRAHEVTKAEFPIGPASLYEPAPAPEGWEG